MMDYYNYAYRRFVNSKWYEQTYSERVERVLMRCSVGKIIRREELESLTERMARKLCHPPGSMVIVRTVLNDAIALANSRWLYRNKFVWRGNKHYAYFEIVQSTPTSFCKWCDKPLFSVNRKIHCGSRICRELHAVRTGMHKEIRIQFNRGGRLDYETAKAKFIATFFLRKHGTLRKANKHDDSSKK